MDLEGQKLVERTFLCCQNLLDFDDWKMGPTTTLRQNSNQL